MILILIIDEHISSPSKRLCGMTDRIYVNFLHSRSYP